MRYVPLLNREARVPTCPTCAKIWTRRIKALGQTWGRDIGENLACHIAMKMQYLIPYLPIDASSRSQRYVPLVLFSVQTQLLSGQEYCMTTPVGSANASRGSFYKLELPWWRDTFQSRCTVKRQSWRVAQHDIAWSGTAQLRSQVLLASISLLSGIKSYVV